jgi:beta-glucosidase
MSVARLVVPALRWRDDTGFAHERSRIDEALGLGVGGFILFGGTAAAVRELTAELRRRAPHPLLVAADLERGAGQQFDGLTQVPPPRALASLGRDDVVAWAGAVTAREARSVGVNWVFAPVADLDVLPDNPIVQTRAFGDDPRAVGRAVATWVRACQAAGALACAKHFPGHGRTSVDSHIALPSVDAPLAQLEAEDLLPFRMAADAGVASLMTAHVAYPALDPSGLPATLSARILSGLRAAGFDGLVVTDALIMGGALAGRSEAEAAVQALAAGADVLLYPERPAEVVATVERAIAEGALPASRVAESMVRLERALAAVQGEGVAPPAPAFGGADGVADLLLAVAPVRGVRPALRAPLDLHLVDDDVGGPYPAVPATTVRATLEARGVPLGAGGSRVVLAFAEPRAWKGRSGFGPASRRALEAAVPGADLVLLFGHERLAAEIPAGPPVMVAWHRQRLMQAAAGRWLAAQVGTV